jgi:signal peptidase II
MKALPGGLRWIWVSLLVLVLDQASKALASATLVLHQPVPVFSSFNLTLMHNRGAAFSFLSQAGGWQRWLFLGVALAVTAGILWWLGIALALVLGGAVGNVWDRVVLGYVVDFLDFYYGTRHWPAFNVADSAISVGAVMLVIDGLRGQRTDGPGSR